MVLARSAVRVPISGIVWAATAALTAAGLRGPSLPADLHPETAAAYDRYIGETDARIQRELAGGAGFLWHEVAAMPDPRRREVADALRRGEVVLEGLTTREGDDDIEIPHGLVHHWVGLVFVPGATRDRAVDLMQAYDRHGEIFAPKIARSRLLSRNDDRFVFTMRFVVEGTLSAVLQTDQEAQFFFPAPDRAHSRIISTRTVEIANAGTPQETAKPEGHDRGYLWRQTSYWRFLERDGGAYVQCEVVSLSRDLPFGLGWLFGRAAKAVPRDTLSFTLDQVQQELSRAAPP